MQKNNGLSLLGYRLFLVVLLCGFQQMFTTQGRNLNNQTEKKQIKKISFLLSTVTL